jgi:CHAT domain-containing protein/tetratricopeptide (TPR) repeat protein
MRIWRVILSAILGAATVLSLPAQTPAFQGTPAQPQPRSSSQQAPGAFADKLIAAPSEDARNTLLDANKDMVTPELVRAINARGSQLRSKGGSYSEVHQISLVALAVAERVNDPSQIAACFQNIGRSYMDEGDYEKALDYGRKAIALAEPLNDPALPFYYNMVGTVFHFEGNFSASEDNLKRGLGLAEAAGNKKQIGPVALNLGNLYADMGNSRLALEQFKRSLEVNQALGDELRVAYNMNSIGGIYWSQGDYDVALSYFQQSLKLREKAGNPSDIANALINLGDVYHDMGKDTLARETLEKALALKEAAGDRAAIAIASDDYGSVLQSQGDYEQALARYKTSLELNEALGNKYEVAKSLMHMADVYHAQRNYQQAMECGARALELARQVGSEALLLEVLDGNAAVLDAMGKPDQARAELAESIHIIEELRGQVVGAGEEQAQFLSKNIGPYRLMVQLLLSQNKPEEAFRFAEQAKARVLLDVVRTGRVSVEKALTQPERSEEHRLVDHMMLLNAQLASETAKSSSDAVRLRQLNADLKQARFDYRNFQTTLYAAHPELEAQRGQAQAVSVSETASLLPDSKTALLEFVVTNDKTHLFVLTKGAGGAIPHLTTYTVAVGEKGLAARVEAFRQQLATRDPDYGKSARVLFRLLLGPAHALIAGKSTLVIVPDGPLWELPFQALQVREGHHLLEDVALAYAPSLTVLGEMMKQQSDARGEAPRLLALGNPMLKNPALVASLITARDRALEDRAQRGGREDLPSAEREVASLARLYGAQSSKVYIRSAASEQVFKDEAPNYNVLHLATHGVFDNSSPMYSHLVLSDGGTGEDDGLLEAWEVIRLNLKARLVVLSACETARGKVAGGEGLIGMAWAFFVAGTPSLVASQWKVDSASTTDLMLRFHRELESHTQSQQPSMTKARALQQAAISVMRRPQYRHPFYWAGFVLIGDGR